LEGISKKYDSLKVLRKINWEIKEGEFMVLVGPSGCGKSTLLKTILGVLKPSSGNIYIDGKMILDIPISERNIGFVPQNFGLFPHLSVFDNISYGLRIRKVKRDTIKTQIKKLLEMLKIDNLENRKPHELSWGQQQRVALARALAIGPNILLLDEPLSSVDWITRWNIAHEIKKIQEKLRITTIYVTHDIDEAFELGHRITIMNEGRLEQCDSPENLIKNPINSFVSNYVYQGKESKRRKIMNEIN